MTPEIWTIIGVAVPIMGLILAQGRFTAQRFDKQFEAVNKQFEAVNKQFEAVNKRFDGVEMQIGDVRKDLAEVRDRVSRVEGSVQTLLQVITERRVA